MMQLISIAAFLKRKLQSSMHGFRRESLVPWLEWHAQRNQVIYVEKEGKLLGAILGRAIEHPKDAKHHYRFQEGSPLVYVDHCVALKPGVAESLYWALWRRFPQASHVMFARAKNMNRYKIYDIERLIALTRKMKTI